ncbi:hypothetical protein NE237_003340 [Protea cynaroides]|uniref:Transcription repressor n=1 Tax=Protea cynaroides TaxID=273540 RepID=A0A9Q0KGV8_9MAGN|nr:hypothetical protein NE237_003340 [Protea cynaroides]
MKVLPSLFKSSRDTKSSSSSWIWPSCKQSKTFSFRADDDKVYKTVNSVYIDGGDVVTTPESWFTNSSESASFSTVSEDSGGEWVETVIRGLRSERLFFEPGESNSILEEAKAGGFPFKESLVFFMESKDPYVDFRTSMEEMVEAHGLKDWKCLEELLGWYLRVNGRFRLESKATDSDILKYVAVDLDLLNHVYNRDNTTRFNLHQEATK